LSVSQPRRYVIVGSGVAGISAAQTIRANDPQGEITILSDDPAHYYSKPGLAYYLTGEISEDTLSLIQKKDLAALRLQWRSQRATSLNPLEHRIGLAKGEVIPYDRLLIATGSTAALLKALGASARGVYKLDNLEDARAILQHSRKSRSAVVVGGGITALELVEGLRAQGVQVNFFLRGERYWNQVLDEAESAIVLTRLQAEGVRLHYRAELQEILVNKDKVVGVTTQDGRQVKCDLVAYAIGVQPRRELAQSSGLHVDRGILADEYLRTSDPDIYAAGDVAQVWDPFSQKSALDTLWGTARQQGQVAGRNMAGLTTCYQKNVPFNVTRLAGLTTTIVGMVGNGSGALPEGIDHGDSETWSQTPESIVLHSLHGADRLRMLVGAERLLGAIIMGDQALSYPLQELIQHRADIRPIRHLLKDGVHLEEVVAAYWKKWSSENLPLISSQS
jgi:NADPH-dependent 2,4-dienoyl-CoA reductase/sulfur reductase-like enzyme